MKTARLLAAADRARAARSAGDVFGTYRKKIALQTLRLSDAGANILGGMSKAEARAFLAETGLKPEQIARIEAA